MKVLHINTYDQGGAAIACIRLHYALLECGVDSHLLTMTKTCQHIPNHYSYEELTGRTHENLLNRLDSLVYSDGSILSTKQIKQTLAAASRDTDVYSTVFSDFRIEEIGLIETFDIINLHWVARFINWPTFFDSKTIRKVIWSLHDMSPFSGGYHYSKGYQGFKSADENPPFLQETPLPDLAMLQLAEKIRILHNTAADIHIVALSNWMLECSRQSRLFSQLPHRLIPNSLNTRVFSAVDKQEARQQLGLPLTRKIALFVSDQLANQRKGLPLLLESLNSLNMKDLVLCCIGKKSFEPDLAANNEIVFLGPVSEEERMMLAYNAADVFISPSVEDNLPNVVVESLCCGTPVIGFEIGGMTDLVDSGQNGLLSATVSAEELALTIRDFFLTGVSLDRQAISAMAHRKYAYSVQAHAYMELLNDLIEQDSSASRVEI